MPIEIPQLGLSLGLLVSMSASYVYERVTSSPRQSDYECILVAEECPLSQERVVEAAASSHDHGNHALVSADRLVHSHKQQVRYRGRREQRVLEAKMEGSVSRPGVDGGRQKLD